MKFPFFWNRNDKEMEFQKNCVLNEQNIESQQPADPYEAIRAAEREKQMLGDERVTKYLDGHPEYHSLIPALSPVNRTTNLSKSEARIAWLDFQILYTLAEMTMDPAKYESGGLENIQGFEILSNTQISDGTEGWKGRIVTEQRKTIRTELKKWKFERS